MNPYPPIHMMRCLIFASCLMLATPVFAGSAGAVEAPALQIPVGADQIVRGRFVEEHQMAGAAAPMQSFGHFTAAPARGLIWSIESPFATTTIVTRDKAMQDVGGFALKLSAKHLRPLFDIVAHVLAADWDAVAQDFIVTPGKGTDGWHMTLTPRPDGQAKTPYATITITGRHFVESIVMIKPDGSRDALHFTDEALSPARLLPTEVAAFAEAGQ